MLELFIMQIALQSILLFLKFGDLEVSLLAESDKLHAVLTQLIILLIVVLLQFPYLKLILLVIAEMMSLDVLYLKVVLILKFVDLHVLEVV